MDLVKIENNGHSIQRNADAIINAFKKQPELANESDG